MKPLECRSRKRQRRSPLASTRLAPSCARRLAAADLRTVVGKDGCGCGAPDDSPPTTGRSPVKYLVKMRATLLLVFFMMGTSATAVAQDVASPWDILFRYGLSLLIDDPVRGQRSPIAILRCVLWDGSSVDIKYLHRFRPSAPAGLDQAVATCRALQQRWHDEHPIQPIILAPVIANPPAPPPGQNTGDAPAAPAGTEMHASNTPVNWWVEFFSAIPASAKAQFREGGCAKLYYDETRSALFPFDWSAASFGEPVALLAGAL